MRERGLPCARPPLCHAPFCLVTFHVCPQATLLPSRVTYGSFGLHLVCVHGSLPQRPTLPASLPLTQTAPMRFERLAVCGNIICSVASDSFSPLVVESGDEPT